MLAPAGHTDKWDSVYGIRRRMRTLILNVLAGGDVELLLCFLRRAK